LELVAEALDAAADAHQIAAVEAAAEQVGVAEHPRGQRARAVAQLEREVRRAGPGRQPVLAGAGVHAVDLVAGPERAQLDGGHRFDDGGPGGRSATVIWDAAAPLGSPA
jgi:hypothetical protein